MAKKNKRKLNRSRKQGRQMASPGTSAPVEQAEMSDDANEANLAPATLLQVKRVTPATNPRRRLQTSTASTIAESLDPEDASIPIAEVPYVPRDLKRVLIMASLMVIIIIVADIIVTKYVK